MECTHHAICCEHCSVHHTVTRAPAMSVRTQVKRAPTAARGLHTYVLNSSMLNSRHANVSAVMFFKLYKLSFYVHITRCACSSKERLLVTCNKGTRKNWCCVLFTGKKFAPITPTLMCLFSRPVKVPMPAFLLCQQAVQKSTSTALQYSQQAS